MVDDAVWDMWADAVIDCVKAGQERSLRGPGAGALPVPAPMFVLTAYNPMGEERDELLNEVAERELERRLTAKGVIFWPATGRSRDASWSEPGVAVAGLDRSEACALGCQYEQLAIYELTAEEVHVVRCADAAIMRTRSRAE
jgi:hypothetical protein